jgi:hypothetical protein
MNPSHEARCLPVKQASRSTLVASVLLSSVLGLAASGCDMVGAQVRGAAGLPPVQRGWATVVNNGVIQICKMHVANETEAYLESYSLISTQFEYLGPGAKHRFEIVVHGAPLKIRLSACDGTVLKELHNVALADGAEMQVVVP